MTRHRVGARPAIRTSSPSDQVVWSSGSSVVAALRHRAGEYLSWEADAHRATGLAVLRVPDLLCTPEYTRALLLSDRVFCAQHMVGGRLTTSHRRRDQLAGKRQDRLFGQSDRPLEYTAVLEESALRRVVGDHRIMRAQLLALLGFAGTQAVTLRVVPEKACGQIGTDGGFTLLDFPSRLYSPMMFAHYPGGVLAEHEGSLIARARQRFDVVLNAALPEAHSSELVDQLATDLYST